VAISFHL
jgi:hypothetical protein